MKIRKSELKAIIMEVLNEKEINEARVAKQKGVVKGARPNEKKIRSKKGAQ